MKLVGILAIVSIYSFAGIGGGHGHDHGNEHSHGDGPSHSHSIESKEIDAKQAEEAGRKKIRVLVFQDKVDESWNSAKFDTAKIKEFEGKKEWVLTFTNEKGVKGKKLYVFLKLSGEFVAANFTGK